MGTTTLVLLGRQHRWYAFDGETAKFELPTELPGTSEDLQALLDQATAAFQDTYAASGLEEGRVATDQDLEELNRLGDIVTQIRSAKDEVEQSEVARSEQAAELRRQVLGDEADADETDEADTDEPDDADNADADNEDDADNEADTDSADADDQESIQASGGRRGKGGKGKAGTSFRGLNRARGTSNRQQASTAPKRKAHAGYLLDAGAPNYTANHVTSLAVAEAFDRIHPGANPRVSANSAAPTRQVTLATLERTFTTDLLLDPKDSQERVDEVLSTITNERLLKSDQGEGSLVAAGGWCAPSETVYDFLGITDAADLLDLPELGIRRGGIRFPVQPDFGNAFQDPGFLYTEAQAMAQTEPKPCFEVPCVGFDEVRLDAIGLCITAGLLQNKGYPESVRLFIDAILKAHQHRISSYSIQAILAESGAAIVIPDTTVIGAHAALLNSMELAATDMAARRRDPYGTTYEVITTTWARPALRRDLANRQGVDYQSVTDAQLDAHFAARNVRVQYVVDWQTGAPGQPGAEVPITDLPDVIDFVIYPAGTFFRALENVIEVGPLYDQAQLRMNRYTALFTEDGIAVGKRGTDSRRYRVPLQYNGAVGPRLDIAAAIAGAGA